MDYHVFQNPKWINSQLINARDLNDISSYFLDDLRGRLKHLQSENPEISICISAWNEELNIIRCLDSLSKSKIDSQVEIVVINNNSKDRTQEMLDKLDVRSFFQPIQGCGVSRQLAQEMARGTYILLADADCYYPETWIKKMYLSLIKKGVSAVYSRHSFLGDKDVARWKYFLYEIGKDMIIELRHFKRPYLNAYGMSLGYKRDHGLKEGFVTRNIRGEDGRLCFDLMKYGRIVLVRNRNARVWTSDRNFEKDGSFYTAIYKRILKEIYRIKENFTDPIPHDTKTSKNTELTIEEYKKEIKSFFTRGKRKS